MIIWAICRLFSLQTPPGPEKVSPNRPHSPSPTLKLLPNVNDIHLPMFEIKAVFPRTAKKLRTRKGSKIEWKKVCRELSAPQIYVRWGAIYSHTSSRWYRAYHKINWRLFIHSTQTHPGIKFNHLILYVWIFIGGGGQRHLFTLCSQSPLHARWKGTIYKNNQPT